MRWIRIDRRRRGQRLGPLRAAGILAAAIALMGVATYGIARDRDAGPPPNCATSIAPQDSVGTILALGDRELFFATGDCHLKITVTGYSEIAGTLAAGSTARIRHAPGVHAGSRVLLTAQPAQATDAPAGSERPGPSPR